MSYVRTARLGAAAQAKRKVTWKARGFPRFLVLSKMVPGRKIQWNGHNTGHVVVARQQIA